MQEVRLALPTEGKKGKNDVVSDVFGRAKTFTIVQIEEGSIGDVEVLENPAASYRHGAGPIAVKMLVDRGVNAAAAREFGPGASTLLEQHGVRMFKVRHGTPVYKVVEELLKKM